MNKKIMSLVLVLALALTAIGGTLAYFTDSEKADNVFTVGNVDVMLHERYDADTAIAEDNTEKYQAWMAEQEMMPGVAVAKIVNVSNQGSQPAYIRAYVTVPNELEPTWNQNSGWTQNKDLTKDTTDATVYVWELDAALQPDADTTDNALSATSALLTAVTLKSDITSINDGTYIVPVEIHAIQAAGFQTAKEAYDALTDAGVVTKEEVANLTDANKALEDGGLVVLKNNMDVKGTDTVVMNNGGVLDGDGNTLNRTATGLTASTNGGVLTTGGTVKNITITGATATDSTKDYGFRAIYVTAGLTSNLTIDNAKLAGKYALNITGNSEAYSLAVKDSELNGWVSYAKLASATFDNVDFVTTADDGVNVLKPYCDTTLTDCDFTKPYTLGNGDGVEYVTITMNNVKVGDDLVTAANVNDMFTIDKTFHGTIIVDGTAVFVD